ncbi:putative BOI-related E3 ubiquitin-protein ligase 3 [Morella rubra]|uniref:Putative BOI-related E3 ubiquitin-protein ligase 3 n=1 Tax=Morella rubra TaxID=262757 RepID=A0A6A1UUF9_9ROSI|nr:putative BOI-related E3 ubiquitin-protein ligase 3 [Morella rubra]
MVKMAVQTHLYPEHVGLPMCGLQDPAFGFVDDLCFSPQYPQQTAFHLLWSSQKLGVDYNEGLSTSSSCYSFPPMAFFQSLDAQFELQNHEIDRILQLQNESLRLALQEQNKQALAVLFNNVESKALRLIREKEEDLARATVRAMELQECLKKVEMERETWQGLAKANESMVIDLNNALERERERLVLFSNTAEDAASFCGSGDQREDRGQDEVKRRCKRMTCKGCYSRSSCVLFLPCRHLCSCKLCEALLDSCPVCNAEKVKGVEVFLD